MRAVLDSVWFLPAFVVMLLTTLEIGYRAALRSELHGPYRGRPVEGAVVGLLALMLGFTFNQAGSAYRERLTLIHEESDAISHVYRFSGFLPPEDRAWMRQHLHSYLEKVLQSLAANEATAEVRDRVSHCHAELMDYVCATVRPHTSAPEALAMGQAVERLIQTYYRGRYARQERLPIPVLLFLVLGSLLVGLMIGFSLGTHGRRTWVIPLVFCALTVLTLGIIWDLDGPYEGFLRVDVTNLQDILVLTARP